MGYDAILAELDEQQRTAAAAEVNAVVTAGAGSGKTKVLAARYAWLIMEQGLRVDEILTLTFTNKAVSEMYSRIYSQLAQQAALAAPQDNQRAREAVRDFHKANICTIDSFCAGIARTASRRYGIAPDFTSDDEGVQDMAMEMALPFILEHRRNPALQILMADRNIRTVAEKLFAQTVLNYSSITSPLDFDACMRIQAEELLRRWREVTGEAAELIGLMSDEMPEAADSTTKTKTYGALKNALEAPLPEGPDISVLLREGGFPAESLPGTGTELRPNAVLRPNAELRTDAVRIRKDLAEYLKILQGIQSVVIRKAPRGMEAIKEYHSQLKNGIYGEILSIANFALQSKIIASVFPLLDDFQRQFHRKKREAGLLTFQDIAQLAVDALARYPDIRQVYKQSLKAIMIDEFQDNNALQRDLIFLLAEKPERREPGIPPASELTPGRMFFVGDEKQSIYRFRGADVSVFRLLSQTLIAGTLTAGSLCEGTLTESSGASLSLIHNYRSKPTLIAAFNRIFGGLSQEETESAPGAGVFLSDDGTGKLPDYEALYSRVHSPHPLPAIGTEPPPVHFCFLDKDELPEDDPNQLSPEELEAAFIALKIRELVDSGYPVQERGRDGIGSRPCGYSDFAVLQRSTTYQKELEKQFRTAGIPYSTENLTGLFNDAPGNDIYNILRLIVYPGDSNAYTAVIRSPFVRLGDNALAICLLKNTGIPFDETLEPEIPAAEQPAYRRARELYRSLVEASRTMNNAALVTRLWYDEGYRYETLWNSAAQIYTELYDFFFELARRSDERGKTLADFLGYLDDVMDNIEKVNNIDIPSEREAGVRLMTIHKSKGLEFPVVFVFGCGRKGKEDTNSEPVYFSERWGAALNVPDAEELQALEPKTGSSALCGNYFYNLQKQEEQRKNTAELRRLLYVAMTRAESQLFVTGALPPRTKEEREAMESENPDIMDRICQLAEKKSGNPASAEAASFFDLLLPVIASCENQGEFPPFTVSAIPVFTRKGLHARFRSAGTELVQAKPAQAKPAPPMQSAAAEALPLYEAASCKESASGDRASSEAIPASRLWAPPCPPLHPGTELSPAEPDPIRGGLNAADFGTVVHNCIQSYFIGTPQPFIPSRILALLDDKTLSSVLDAARLLAEGFFRSELGEFSLKAQWREPEFPFISVTGEGSRKRTITGQIDLLFFLEGTVHVVDFKTDTVDAPEQHYGQLAAYHHAAADIYRTAVRSWIFFLRTGRAVEVTEAVQDLAVEELENGE